MSESNIQLPKRPWGDVPRGRISAPAGVLLIDKDAGVTSHDVVGAVRRLAATNKVGHAGTLDPLATGLLTIGIGKATKLLTYLTGCDKTYETEIFLGVSTTTEDAQGEFIAPDLAAKSILASIGESEVDQAICSLIGKYAQIPSAVSAKKINGKRAYDLVRAGQEVSLSPVEVEIYDFQRLSPLARNLVVYPGWELLSFRARVSCSAGTYIRALARDLGERLGLGAHIRQLRRTVVGQWNVQQAYSVTQLVNMVDVTNQKIMANLPETTEDTCRLLRETLIETGKFAVTASAEVVGEITKTAEMALPVIPIARLCRQLFPIVILSAQEVQDLQFGRFIPYRHPDIANFKVGKLDGGSAVFAAFNTSGEAVALVKPQGKHLRPILQLI